MVDSDLDTAHVVNIPFEKLQKRDKGKERWKQREHENQIPK